MRNRDEIDCNCFSLFGHQDKAFLARRKEKEEKQIQKHIRHQKVPSEVKCQSEPKSQKKSLKKRPVSQKPGETHGPLQIERAEVDMHIIGSQRVHRTESHYQNHKTNHPSTLIYNEPMSVRNHPLSHQPANFNFNNPVLMPHNYTINVTQSSQKQPQTSRVHTDPPRISNYYKEKPQREGNIQPFNEPKNRPITTLADVRHLRDNRESKNSIELSATESQVKINPSQLFIEGFDSMVNRRQERTKTCHEKVGIREAKNSKRFEKKLFGRFAQSDNESDEQESTPSEVIGRGMEGQSLWDFDSRNMGKDTLSGSTNTKMSFMPKTFHEFQAKRRKLGEGKGNFQSYDKL